MDKLKIDFGDSSSAKYVFKGLPEITNNVAIIDGENYETKGIKATTDTIQINIFNISKINADSKATTKDGKTLPPKIKRFRETIGDSYYNYLMNLKDLVIIMDESHRYRGAKGMETLNELNPILGIELTATPIVSDTNSRFKNIVYEYGLADALKEKKYIKVPAVVTRKDVDFSGLKAHEIETLKLKDAIQLHKDTKLAIENYAAENDKPVVKPIILVACSDTEHATKIFNYISSDEFYKGNYKDKVLQIDSTTKDDEQIEQLLTLEKPDNFFEIVIHVDMLKEGWDVANLYTIVPLRASNAKILIEQTIGRGLRLPYNAEPSGVEKVDMLSIVEHEKFDEVLKLAKDKNYNFGQRQLTQSDLTFKKESIISKTIDEVDLEDEKKKIELIKDPKLKQQATQKHIAKKLTTQIVKQKIAERIFNSPTEIQSVKVKEQVIEEIKQEVQREYPAMSVKDQKSIVNEATTEFNVTIANIIKFNINIPNIKISLTENSSVIEDFDLDVSSISEKKLDHEFKLIRETLYEHKRDEIQMHSQSLDIPEYIIMESLKKKPEIDDNYSEILYKLCNQAVSAIKVSLKDASTLSDIVIIYRELITLKIYEQIKQHFKVEVITESKVQAEPYAMVVNWKDLTKDKADDILNFTETVSTKTLTSKVFNGFVKACHQYYKFDSLPEKQFAEIIESSNDTIVWMRPASKQFNIWYNNRADRYQPDFVVETKYIFYLVEIKAENEMDDKIVHQKTQAAVDYCKKASEINSERNEKAWKYVIIPHIKIKANMTLNKLLEDYVK